ncbi:mediator of RNA polymerase II transcription subunit 8 isoform X2 [Carya illinoinensis]|uniref:mediator of RNA polymerase II transcription subunit 8 isoform X2 n=1 Tax=Carya illinoinensis TaxID=32201 RepID=UPI001C71921B|nr:mediator of RNA polymerase II transcription subunit 8 isoform X2 [Carya illinoinensis]
MQRILQAQMRLGSSLAITNGMKVLPVMLSSKLLPEMEMDDNSKREQLLHGMQNLPISSQIEKLKARIDMIGAACESAEKVLADTRKAYCFGARQGPSIAPTLDKGQAAKIHEQENLLRAAVHLGEGLRMSGEHRQITPALPLHLVDVVTGGDGMQSFADASGMYLKNNPMSSNSISGQGTLLSASASQLIGRSAASPGATSATSFDNTAASPLQYANSPRSGTNMMNTPSPQQQTPQQQQQQQQQQLRQKLMQIPQHQPQILAQQQFRQSTMQGLAQNQQPQLHDLQGQAQQKFQSLHGQNQMQFSQAMGHQQFQRQLPSGHVQHGIGQSQLNQGNQMNRHLSQFSGNANSALFNAAQATSNTQMIPNISATMSSQSLIPRMQFGLSGSNPQRSHASQILSDQMFNMGAANPSGMMPIQQQQQQQQHGSQTTFGNMQPNAQNLQPGMVALQNTQQNLPNFSQQRQQNPQ